MEKMPYQSELDMNVVIRPPMTDVTTTDWQHRLPTLTGHNVVLRELRTSDAQSLFAMLTTEEVSRFISPPPSTVEGFERFIAWTLRMRTAGTYACFAVTLKGHDTAEWGFAIGSPFWGTGIFADGADLVLEFAFETLGVHRLEARCAVKNG